MPIHATHQRGAALATSLLLLTVMAVVGVTGATQAQREEQGAAALRQQVDAMMAAEYGAQVVDRQVRDWVVTTNEWPDAAEAAAIPDSGWQDMGGDSADTRAAQQWQVSRVDADGTTAWIYTIEGAIRVDGEITARRSVRLRAEREVVPPPPVFPFGDGVVSCGDVNQVGSATIDSFNSNDGAYGADLGDGRTNAQTGEVQLRTIEDGADGTFSGNAPVYGDVAITGDLQMSGGTPIYGSLDVGGSGGDVNGTVHGASSFGGDVSFGTSSDMRGPVLADGNVTVSATSTPPPAIDASGDISYPSWWQWNEDLSETAENYRAQQEGLELAPIRDPNEVCDPLAIRDPDTGGPGQRFEDVWSDPDTVTIADYFAAQGCPECVAQQGDETFFTGGIDDQDAANTTIGADGERVQVRVDTSLGTKGRLETLTVRGDVTMVVDGGFRTGGASSIAIAPGANLTVLVTGETDLGGGSSIVTDAEQSAFMRNGKPAFSLYSSYESGQGSPGVNLRGANNSAVAIYAPATEARIVGSGEMFGAVRAGNLDLRGSGDIHYDVALNDFEASSPTAQPSMNTRAADWWEGE